jgi:hypothetical protein
MIDETGNLLDDLPANVRELANEAVRLRKAGPPRYLPATLAQVGLPRSPTPGRTFERRSGNVSLQIEAGSIYDGLGWRDCPLPYGIRPRLALIHITTEALRTRSKSVDVRGSVYAFLEELGLAVSTKGMKQMREQMIALAACTIRLGRTEHSTIDGKDVDQAVTVHAQPFREFRGWPKHIAGQRSLFPVELELTQEFYDSILNTSVPLKAEALAKLSNSALALDIYTWLAHRLWRVKRGGSRISWAALQEQFGGEYADRKQFKRQFRIRLHEALSAYPEARVDDVGGGILLKASPTPIPRSRVTVLGLGKTDDAN